MLKQVNEQSQKLSDQRVSVEADIQQQIQKLHELLEARKAELINQFDEQVQVKMKSLVAQKDELETSLAQLDSCVSFVRETLRTGSKGEVTKMKNMVMKQIKDLSSNFKQDLASPCEATNWKFITSLELTQACQQFGRLVQQNTSPEKC